MCQLSSSCFTTITTTILKLPKIILKTRILFKTWTKNKNKKSLGSFIEPVKSEMNLNTRPNGPEKTIVYSILTKFGEIEKVTAKFQILLFLVSLGHFQFSQNRDCIFNFEGALKIVKVTAIFVKQKYG